MQNIFKPWVLSSLGFIHASLRFLVLSHNTLKVRFICHLSFSSLQKPSKRTYWPTTEDKRIVSNVKGKVISQSGGYHSAQNILSTETELNKVEIIAAHRSQNEERKVEKADFEKDVCKIRWAANRRSTAIQSNPSDWNHLYNKRRELSMKWKN